MKRIYYITMTQEIRYRGGERQPEWPTEETLYLSAMRKNPGGTPMPYFTYDRDLARGFKAHEDAAAVLEVAKHNYDLHDRRQEWEVRCWPVEAKYFRNRLFGDDGKLKRPYAGAEDPTALEKFLFPKPAEARARGWYRP